MFSGNTTQLIALAALPVLFGITLHEAAHGWVASKLGDQTAKMLGRVSLNPIKHIDIFGTLLLPLLMLMVGGVIFGWAKPVPITAQNLRRPRRDMALVAFAGPLANLVMALLWALIAKISTLLLTHSTTGFILESAQFFSLTGRLGISLNVVLFTLNLLPLPPLDGSRLLSSLLPSRWAAFYDQLEPWGLWILLALLFLGVLKFILFPPIEFLTGWITAIAGL